MARGSRLARVGALGLLAALTLGGCDLTGATWRFGWPIGVTDQAKEMRQLWTGAAIAALIVGFLVWGLIIWAIIRYRKRSDELPRQTAYNLPLEIVYTIIPFIMIAVLFFFTVRKTGAYVGHCAELCGTYHAFMNFEVRAVSPSQYDAYLAAREKGMTTAQALSSIGQAPYAVTTHPFNLAKQEQLSNG